MGFDLCLKEGLTKNIRYIRILSVFNSYFWEETNMLGCGNPEALAVPIVVMFFLLSVFLFVVPLFLFKLFLWWRIFSKVGYSGAFGLLLLAPFGTMIMLCILAFSNWPTGKKP